MAAINTALLICEKHGLQYFFIIPAVVIFMSAIFAAIFMPETHGLSLKAIGEIYTNIDAGVKTSNRLLACFLLFTAM